MFSSRILPFMSLLAAAPLSPAAITESFDTYPSGGSGWTGSWVESTSASNVDGSVVSTTPLNGGGNYLSVTTAVSGTELGIKRGLGSTASSSYTLTFDWRLDSTMSNFTAYNDRIHIGANSDGDFGTDVNWNWIIGVVGADNGGTPYDDGKWYFYDANTASDSKPGSTLDVNGNGTFVLDNMRVSTLTLTSGVVYSFVVTVNPDTKTYDASITDGVTTYSQTGMDFRNQVTASANFSNLVFGGSTSATSDNLTWSLDNINIVPEPSSLILAGLSGLLCFKRRRN